MLFILILLVSLRKSRNALRFHIYFKFLCFFYFFSLVGVRPYLHSSIIRGCVVFCFQILSAKRMSKCNVKHLYSTQRLSMNIIHMYVTVTIQICTSMPLVHDCIRCYRQMFYYFSFPVKATLMYPFRDSSTPFTAGSPSVRAR